MKNFLTITLLLFGYCIHAFSQQEVEITGTVTDTNKEPLIGVNITVSEMPGLGTITDINGNYKIKMEPYRKLVFSYIGFEKEEVLVKEQRVIDVIMKESVTRLIDELVVTGTGTQKKLTVTGAVTSVNVSVLKNTSSSSIVNTLAGNVPGIVARQLTGRPGTFSEFWIRGISTFGATKGAYVLVDGFERDLNEINIEDIESFSVLKDASATAIYGAKGANGVILITTKYGKPGKISINSKVEATCNTPTYIPEFVDGPTYANLVNEARITRNHAPIYQPEELEILRLGFDPDLYPNVDWMKMLLRRGSMSYRANLNMSGGGATARYFASGSYVEDQGIFQTDEAIRKDYNTNTNYRRYNYRLNTDINITKSTLLRLGVSGSLAKRNFPRAGGDRIIFVSLFGYTPISSPVVYSNGYIPALGDGQKTNPWVLATQCGFDETWDNKIQTNITLEQNFDFIVKGLRFTGNFGYDTNNWNGVFRGKWPEQWLAERSRNLEGELVFKKVVDAKEMYQESASNGSRREYLDMMFNYMLDIESHHFGVDAKYTQDALIGTQNLGGDIIHSLPRRNLGGAGRVKYNWRYRYFADFNFGYTGSENFAIGHQFGFFPAGSVAWNIAEELFIKEHLKWMNMFKLRCSYGKVGNDYMGSNRFPYLYLLQNKDVPGYQWAEYGSNKSYRGMHYQQVASPYVTWEIATKLDFGTDISLFRDRFTFTIDYFDEKREGIFMERKFLPLIVGLESNPKANVGAVRSRGFDGNFKFQQKMGEIDLTIRGNMTYTNYKVLEKDEENNVYPYQMEKGFHLWQPRGLIALGLFKDYDDIRNSPTQQFGIYQPGDIKYKDVNGDGVINNGDQVPIGSTRLPNLLYGVGISAQWKGLDVNLHFQGAGKSSYTLWGKTVYAFSENDWGNVLKGLVNEKRWISADISKDPSTENPDAPYPRLSYGWNSNNFRSSTYWLRNGAYLRLKTVDIGYSLPKKIVNKIRFNKVRVFMLGTNLMTWSSFKLWDPEMANAHGEDYPIMKSVTLGLSVNL